MTDKELYIRNWLIKAEHDLRIIKTQRALPKERIVTDGICFHCQQAAEKALKAYLVFAGRDFGKSHNLEYLAALCAETDESFSRLDFGKLTDYGVAIRYPDDFYMPTIEEADESIRIAREVWEFTLKRLPPQLHPEIL